MLSVSVAEQHLGQVEEHRVISMARIGGSQVVSGVFRADREPLSSLIHSSVSAVQMVPAPVPKGLIRIPLCG